MTIDVKLTIGTSTFDAVMNRRHDVVETFTLELGSDPTFIIPAKSRVSSSYLDHALTFSMPASVAPKYQPAHKTVAFMRALQNYMYFPSRSRPPSSCTKVSSKSGFCGMENRANDDRTIVNVSIAFYENVPLINEQSCQQSRKSAAPGPSWQSKHDIRSRCGPRRPTVDIHT